MQVPTLKKNDIHELTGRERISEQKRQRRERILQMLREDIPFRNIVELEGITPRFLWQTIAELKAEYPDLDYEKPRGERVKSRELIPAGLTQQSYRLRSKLGDRLYFYHEKNNPAGVKLTRQETSLATGLTSSEQLRATQRPYNHDWKLSQIERLAAACDVPLREFLLEILS